MFKLKQNCFLASTNARLWSFPASTTTAIAFETHVHEQASMNPQTLMVDPQFYVSSLLSCKNVLQIRQLHAQVVASGALNNLIVANKLLYVYALHKALRYAHALFNVMTERDAVSWSGMIGGFAKVGDFVNCFGTFREFIRCGMRLDSYTLPSVIRACRDRNDIVTGRLIHGIVLKSGVLFDHFACAALVDMYAKCKFIDDAWQLFDKMPSRDLVTWTVMIGACAESGSASESWVLFERMVVEGIVPDNVAMVSVVYAIAKLGSIDKAGTVHDFITRNKFPLDVILGTAMIDMYAKCGNVDSAREIFDRMRQKNVISWSAMIAAYGYQGEGKKALDLFPMMLSSGISPNKITFLSLLYACSHAGLVEEGLRLFSLMWDDFAVRPDVKHYTCMVDLLGRAGRLVDAMKLIESMTIEKEEGLWGALLGACRIHKNVDLAEMAAKSLLELEPQNPGHYVLLSNIYANSGRWQDVAKIRDLMTQRRLKKIPGWTWIEVENKIHQFTVGHSTHPRSEEIYRMLGTLSEKLELAGYVPDTNFELHDVDEEIKIGNLHTHSEKLAVAFGLIATPEGTTIRIMKNLRVCGDCHSYIKYVSAVTKRVIIVRDANRFHHFNGGACSCRDYW